jgi:hypothetical protein
MDKYLTKNQIKVILDNAPKEVNKEDLLKKFDSSGYTIQGYNDQDKIAAEQKANAQLQADGQQANDFLSKSPLGQIFSTNTLKEVPGAVGDVAKNVLYDTPKKIGASLADIPYQLATGKDLPGTYQSEASQTANDIIDGNKPLLSALAPFIQVPLDVTSTAGLATGISKLGSTAIETAKPAIAKIQAQRALKQAEEVNNIVGKIIQGTPEDITGAKNAISQIDTKGVKTYNDLGAALNDKIKAVSNGLDNTLEQSPVHNNLLKLGDMEKSITVGDQTVRHNYVDDALNQLKTFYSKTGNVAKETAIDQMIAKGNSEGLSVKELNDIAKLHGQDLNGFNANGELASGLSKQAAENTRLGVKSTAREIYGGDAYAQADKQLTDLLKTRDLVQGVDEKVNQLKQRVNERGFGEKVGRLVFQIANKFTGGGLQGFVQSFVPRGQGLKVMNALDLEKALSGNLNAVEKALNQKTENGAIKELNKIIESFNSIPNKQGGFVALPDQASDPFLKSQPKTNIINNASIIPKSISPKETISQIAKNVEATDLDKMTAFVDLYNQGKKIPAKVLKSAQDVADAMQLDSRFGGNSGLAKDFNSIIDQNRAIIKKKMSN